MDEKLKKDIESVVASIFSEKEEINKEIEAKMDLHMKKVTRSAAAMELVLSAMLIIPMISALSGMANATDPIAHAFYLCIAVIAIVGVVLVLLIKRGLMELIYIELATRGHGRDDG